MPACHERDSTIITTLRPVILPVQHYDRDIFPLLRYAPTPPYDDHNGVKLLEYTVVTRTIFIYDAFEQLGRKLIGCNAFWFDMLLMFSSTSKAEGKASRGIHGGHTLSYSTMFGSSAGVLV